MTAPGTSDALAPCSRQRGPGARRGSRAHRGPDAAGGGGTERTAVQATKVAAGRRGRRARVEARGVTVRVGAARLGAHGDVALPCLARPGASAEGPVRDAAPGRGGDHGLTGVLHPSAPSELSGCVRDAADVAASGRVASGRGMVRRGVGAGLQRVDGPDVVGGVRGVRVDGGVDGGFVDECVRGGHASIGGRRAGVGGGRPVRVGAGVEVLILCGRCCRRLRRLGEKRAPAVVGQGRRMAMA